MVPRMVEVVLSLLVGLAAGVLSGMFGIGGGVVMVPALVGLLHYTQKDATGTSLLTLLLPVGALAVISYAREGHVHVKVGLLLAAGLFFGAQVGANIALPRGEAMLRKLFAVLLAATAVRLYVSA
jgi:uncharacterized membrane protein YfcA